MLRRRIRNLPGMGAVSPILRRWLERWSQNQWRAGEELGQVVKPSSRVTLSGHAAGVRTERNI